MYQNYVLIDKLNNIKDSTMFDLMDMSDQLKMKSNKVVKIKRYYYYSNQWNID